MSGPLEQRDGKLRIYLKDDYRRVGRGFTRWGFGLGIPAAVAALVSWAVHPLLGVFTTVAAIVLGVFGLVGALFWAVARAHIEVDPDARVVHLGHGAVLPFDQVVAIHHSSYVYVQRTQNGTTESLRHQVQLVSSEVDPSAAAQLHAVRDALDQAAAEADSPLSPAKVNAIQAELDGMADVFTGAAVLVADHGDELAMWRAAELMARKLDRPLLDFSGQVMMVRTPVELDLPLRTRLARKGDEVPDDPGPPPAGLEVDARRLTFKVRWKHGFGSWFTGRRHLLAVNEEQAAVNPNSRKALAIPLTSLEAVRVSTELHNRVVLISDERMIQCVFKEEAQALWLGDALTRFIAALPEKSGPYR
jgi:hypothetical protein